MKNYPRGPTCRNGFGYALIKEPAPESARYAEGPCPLASGTDPAAVLLFLACGCRQGGRLSGASRRAAAMADEEAVRDGLARRMEGDHELLAASPVTARPLTVSAPLLLNTGDLQWESVEHLVAWLARRVEGWEETWLYGERGQNQHGIDVVGVTGRNAAVFQAKRLKEFTQYDLEHAVGRYVRGERPFGARRLVVVTTHDANRTEISEKLFELRGTYPDLQIELWNRKRLSDLLRPHPDIVTAFFGANSCTHRRHSSVSSACPPGGQASQALMAPDPSACVTAHSSTSPPLSSVLHSGAIAILAC